MRLCSWASRSMQEAIALLESLRLSSVELQATIEQKLADTRQDIRSVDWQTEGEMCELLGIDPAIRIDDSQTEPLAIQVLKRLSDRALTKDWYWCKYQQIYLNRSKYPLQLERSI
jgi:hypothetical protein